MNYIRARLPQPPFAKLASARLASFQRQGVLPFRSLIVHAGANAWHYKGEFSAFLLAPEDLDPADMDWSVCTRATPPILLINRAASDAHLAATARAILRDGVKRVFIIGIGGLGASFTAKEMTYVAN